MSQSNSTGCEDGNFDFASGNDFTRGLIMALTSFFAALRLRGILSYALYRFRLFGIERAPEATRQQAWAVRTLAVTSAITGILMISGYSLYLYKENLAKGHDDASLALASFQFLSYNLW